MTVEQTLADQAKEQKRQQALVSTVLRWQLEQQQRQEEENGEEKQRQQQSETQEMKEEELLVSVCLSLNALPSLFSRSSAACPSFPCIR
jgi:hypothetical protein